MDGLDLCLGEIRLESVGKQIKTWGCSVSWEREQMLPKENLYEPWLNSKLALERVSGTRVS